MKTALALLVAGCLVSSMALHAPAAGGKPQFVYVHDRSDSELVFAWRLDGDGSLTSLEGSPFPGSATGDDCSGHCQTMAASAKKRMLFTGATGGVTAWRIGADGGLSVVEGSPFGPGSGAFIGVAVVEKGKNTFVYSSEVSADRVRGFVVQEDGTLDEMGGSPWDAGPTPLGMVASKKGVFTVNSGDSTVSSWVVAKDGALLAPPGDPFDVDTDFTYNLAVDPNGKILYVPDCATGLIRNFRVNTKTGELSVAPGEGAGSGLQDVCSGLIISKKNLVAVSFNEPEDQMVIFKKPGSGNLKTIGNVQLGGSAGIASHAFDGKGKILVVANGDAEVRTFLVNTKTGSMVTGDTAPLTGANVNGVVVVK